MVSFLKHCGVEEIMRQTATRDVRLHSDSQSDAVFEIHVRLLRSVGGHVLPDVAAGKGLKPPL
jgi:hypothetical protein